MQQVRTDLAALPGVRDATLSYEIPDGANGGSRTAWPMGGDSTRAVAHQVLMTDEHYAETYRIPLAAGVYFNDPAQPATQDSMRVVLNETAAKALGLENAADRSGAAFAGWLGRIDPFTVSGVVKDFHFDGMGSAVQPELFMHVDMTWTYRYLSFKLRPGNIGRTMDQLRRQWAISLPGAPFEYKFMDETLENVYRDELRLKKAASASTGLALVIVLLGVIGMLSHSVQKRTKEIAIRKVIGSSVPGIIRLFLAEYLPLLFSAGTIASPLAYWLMHRWLDDYATRIPITIWPFATAIASLGSIMVLLITAQTIRAALTNPVKSLKME